MKIPTPPWWLVPVLIALVVAVKLAPPAHGKTAEQWLELVTAIQRQPCEYKENPADNLFISKMINLLTLDNPSAPNRAEQKWILALKRECKL